MSRRAPRQFFCKAVVAPATHTNGAALGAGKPVLDSPLWRDSFSSDSQHNTASQLYRQPKSIVPNRLRLFAGTANPVRSRTLFQASHFAAQTTCGLSLFDMNESVRSHWRLLSIWSAQR